MPKVSVVITCYNYGLYLEDAVESVVLQTYRDYEIIIVNDGSTDNTLEVAQGLERKYPGHTIRIIDQENEGFPASRNTGIRNSRGEYIMPLDADDRMEPDYLAETVAVLDNNPGVAYAYTDFGLFGEESGAQKHNPIEGEFDFQLLLRSCYFLGCNLFRKSAWEEVGGYRDVGYEDWEFWIALGEKGHFGKYVDKPLYLWRRHPGSLVAEKFEKNDLLYLRIKLLHPGLYRPRLARAGAGVARASIVLEFVYFSSRARAVGFLKEKHPALHRLLKDGRDSARSLFWKTLALAGGGRNRSAKDA